MRVASHPPVLGDPGDKRLVLAAIACSLAAFAIVTLSSHPWEHSSNWVAGETRSFLVGVAGSAAVCSALGFVNARFAGVALGSLGAVPLGAAAATPELLPLVDRLAAPLLLAASALCHRAAPADGRLRWFLAGPIVTWVLVGAASTCATFSSYFGGG